MTLPDTATCFRAMQSRDRRFDGWFFVAVSSTGIYCRPSCPAAPPRPEHVSFYPTAAAAQAAGYRACLRCRPDASPGSPEWNLRADVAGRAMRLIADGVVDREGVEGLAQRLAYSPRQLRRLLQRELGAGPLSLARAQRAQTARLLIETTALPFADVAFAAGFASLRQFNDTIREVFARSPRELRARAARGAGRRASATSTGVANGNARPTADVASPEHLGAIALRLPVREPFDGDGLLRFFAHRAVPGVEEVGERGLRRTMRLPHGVAVAELTLLPAAKPSPGGRHIAALLRLGDLRDLAAAVSRCRALLDLDGDPLAVDAVLGADPLLAPLVRRRPGKRVAGAADGFEVALRAVLGQQVSVASARITAARLVQTFGAPLAQPDGALTHAFPAAEALAGADPALLPMPAARARSIRALATAVADGRLHLGPGADREEIARRLLELPGIGPWTVSYIAMRALADTDAFPATDLGVLRGLAAIGGPSEARGAAAYAERWRPWRAYAAQHLWDPLQTAATAI
jgi:AraC family transcriptional regulator, regulatory protein of adaptative response / DNA-3-methyladenine glycosylase II